MREFPEITWGCPTNSVWFFLIIGVCSVLIYRFYKWRIAQQRLAGKQLHLLSHVSVHKQIIKIILITCGVLFLCIALLRPQWNKREETIMQEGRDLYIALDISRSMLAADCKPHRLALAKEKIKRLVKKLSCERVGLILFSGSAFVYCPLTTDYAAFYLYLDAVDAELISTGTTALDQAIAQAMSSFACTPERKSKLLVLFTDGEDFSHNLHGIKNDALNAGLSLFTIGIGTTEGAPVPIIDKDGTLLGHQKDDKGSVVISRLNEDILSTLSHDVGGRYIRATDTDEDIASFVKELARCEKEQLGERKISDYEQQYHYFLFISFICFLLEWIL